jgi:hypothetical protein
MTGDPAQPARRVLCSNQHCMLMHTGVVKAYTIERFIMPIINVFVVLIIVGILLWLVNNYIPMAGSIKKILNVVVIIIVILWLLRAFGIISSLSNYKI